MSSNKPQNARTDFFVLPFECRLVWTYLTQKRTKDVNGADLAPDKQYYEATLVFPKTAADPRQCANYAFLAGKLMAVIAQQSGWGGQWPVGGEWPIKDGDEPKFAEKYEWARGCWRINPWSNIPIAAADAGNNPLPVDLNGDYRGIKGGDYALASINAWAWVYGNNRNGISFGIEGVKKTRDGDPIGSSQRSVAQMFGAPTGAPMSYAPAAAAPPLPGPQAAPPGYAPQPQYQPPQEPPAYMPAPPQYQPAPQPQYAPAPGPTTYTPAPPPGPAYAPAPGPAYAPPPGNPVAPPVYTGAPAPGPTYTPPAPQPGYPTAAAPQYAPGPQAAPPAYTPQPQQFAPPIGTR